jgi:hypothetical protein
MTIYDATCFNTFSYKTHIRMLDKGPKASGAYEIAKNHVESFYTFYKVRMPVT